MTIERAIKILERMQEPEAWEPAITPEAFEALQTAIESFEHIGDCVLKQFGECSYTETGCSDCKVKRRISEALKRSEKRRPAMNRLDEAIASIAYISDALMAYRNIVETGRDCNQCGAKETCGYVPKPGQLVRYNCPLYVSEEVRAND